MDLLLAQWKLWDEQIEKLEAEIEKRQAKNATAAVLATIPGCAAYGSLALASRIGSIERFPRPASLANYWGLTPGCRNSGEATDRLGSITKQGSAMARFILGQMVLHVLRRDASDEGVVRPDQAAARVEDRPGGGDASVGDDHLAHGEAQRALRGGRSAAAETGAPGGVRLRTASKRVLRRRIFGGMVGQMNETGRQNSPGSARRQGLRVIHPP